MGCPWDAQKRGHLGLLSELIYCSVLTPPCLRERCSWGAGTPNCLHGACPSSSCFLKETQDYRKSIWEAWTKQARAVVPLGKYSSWLVHAALLWHWKKLSVQLKWSCITDIYSSQTSSSGEARICLAHILHYFLLISSPCSLTTYFCWEALIHYAEGQAIHNMYLNG